MSNITLFSNAITPKDPIIKDHEDIINGIRDGIWKHLIDKLNSFDYDSEDQKKYKRTMLTGIVWQGEFTYRNEENITSHSGMVAIDIDHLPPDELKRYRELITANQYTHALFLSPRRDGLKVIIRIPKDIENHREYVAAIGQQYKKHAPKYYDHFDDPCRLCFVSYDPDIYYNPDSTVWTHRVSLKKFTPSDADTSQVASNAKSTFNRLAAWAEKESTYKDGNKHKHIVRLFAACNRAGVLRDDAVKMMYSRYGTAVNVEPVAFTDFEHRADSVYRLYEADFGTKTFDENLADEFIGTKKVPAMSEETVNSSNTEQSDEDDEILDPVTFFNTANTPRFYVKNLLEELKWKRIPDTSPEVWRTQDADDSEVSATFDTCLHIVSNSCDPFKQGRTYTPYEILLSLRFNGNFRAATEWIITKYFGETIPYIRVGVDYFKVIEAIDRFGIPRKELAKWTKDEIKEDHGKQFISRIPRFNKFVTKPDNINYTPIVGNNYNLYREFPHKPYPGQWPWTEILLRHIFGEQYHLGIRYLQALYLNPEHIMPILVLVSQERQTGKTTFINWLGMVFGDNMANIAPDDLINGFNAPYAASNIIAVEETLIEKAITVEKIKALATQKHITVNQKFVSQYRTPFYGKIILTSNNETKFAKIDQEEIRFFIRKVPVPTTANHNIEEDMIPEIPAFLHYLTTLPPVDWSRDRTGFTPQELDNESLKAVKDESKTEIARDFRIMIEDMFLNELNGYDEFQADAKAIKDRYYAKDPRNGYDWIQKILKKDFSLNPTEKSIYFKPFVTEPGKTGRPFTFKRSDFVTSEPEQAEYQETIPF